MEINWKSMKAMKINEANGNITDKHMRTMEINEITETQSHIMKLRRNAMSISENH